MIRMALTSKIIDTVKLGLKILGDSSYRTLAMKYYSDLGRAKKLERKLIISMYESLPYYKGKDEEMRAVLTHKSRSVNSIVLEALAVIRANEKRVGRRVEEGELVAAHGYGIGLCASMRDDVHDGPLREYLKKFDNLNYEDVCEYITYDRLLEVAKEHPTFKKDGELKSTRSYVMGSEKLEKLFRDEIEKLSSRALKHYLQGKKEIEAVQADDIYLAYLMQRNERKEIFEFLGGTRNLIRALRRRLDRLAIVGEKWPVIVNSITWHNGVKGIGEVNEALAKFSKHMTRLAQWGEDDVPSTYKDIIEKSPTIMTVPTLIYDEEPKLKNLRRYIMKHKNFDSIVAKPIVKSMMDGLGRLKRLEFMYEDASLAARMTMNETRKNLKDLEKELNVKFSYEWYV